MQRWKIIEAGIILWYNGDEVRLVKDFPVFTTEYGVASLILREIPYRQEAYIVVQSSETPEKLLRECISFCRMCGAERIFARGHGILEDYPVHCSILEMRGNIQVDGTMVESLWPVTRENIGDWRSLLNRRMADVDNAGTLTSQGEQEILDRGGAYFIHRDGTLLGAGWITDGELMLIAAAKPGAGEQVLQTLLSAANGEPIRLEVASTNERAIRLYERLGFVKTAELRRWHRVFPEISVQNPQIL